MTKAVGAGLGGFAYIHNEVVVKRYGCYLINKPSFLIPKQ